MSTELRLRALELAVQAGGPEPAEVRAETFYAFMVGTAAAPVGFRQLTEAALQDLSGPSSEVAGEGDGKCGGIGGFRAAIPTSSGVRFVGSAPKGSQPASAEGPPTGVAAPGWPLIVSTEEGDFRVEYRPHLVPIRRTQP